METSDARKRRTAGPEERHIATSVNWLNEVADQHEAIAKQHEHLAAEHKLLAANVRGYITGALTERAQ